MFRFPRELCIDEPKLNLSRVRTRTRSLREGPDSSAASGRLALRDPKGTGTSQSSTEGAAHILEHMSRVYRTQGMKFH